MKKNLVKTILFILFILALIYGWYVSNNSFNVPQKQLEQIQQEEGLK